MTGGTAGASMGQNAVLSGFGLEPILHLMQHATNALIPNHIPSMQELRRLWATGRLSNADYAQYSSLLGVNRPAKEPTSSYTGGNVLVNNVYPGNLAQLWWDVDKLEFEIPAPGELLELLNRGAIDDTIFDLWMTRRGWLDSDYRDTFKKLRYDYPTASDLVHWAVKDVWIDEVVRRYKYDDERPEQYTYWSQTRGAVWPLEVPGANYPADKDLTPALAHWRAHWDLMSPGQAYEAFRRCRKDRMPRIQAVLNGEIIKWINGKLPNNPLPLNASSQDITAKLGQLSLGDRQYVLPFMNVPAFDVHDLGLHLRVANYAPLSRPWLAAISYRPLTRVDIRRMYDLGTMPLSDVKEAYLDLGYSPPDAESQTQFVKVLGLEGDLNKYKRKSVDLVVTSYEVGLVNRADAELMMDNAGVRKTTTSLRLDNADAANALDMGKKVLASVRRRFLKGHISQAFATQILGAAGLEPGAINRHMATLVLELDTPRKELSSAQAIALAKGGIIGVQVAASRLNNLGWSTADAQSLINEACGKKGAKCFP